MMARARSSRPCRTGWARASTAGLLALGLTLSAASCARPSRGSDLRATGSTALKTGFVSREQGGIRWTYPIKAEAQVRSLQEIRQEAWGRISAELGPELGPAFEVRIARNLEEMQELAPPGLRVPTYAVGLALPAHADHGLILLSMTAPKTFTLVDLETVFVHELSHLAFVRATGAHPTPRWLSEGLAVLQAKERPLARFRTLWAGTVAGRLMTLEDLERGFPGRHHRIDLAYAQSADFVAFLRDGPAMQQRFGALIRHVRDGMPWKQAVDRAYRVSIGELERQWNVELRRRFGRLPLILSGLAGLGVVGLLLLLMGYARGRRRDAATLRRWNQEERAEERAAAAARLTRASEQGPGPSVADKPDVYVPSPSMPRKIAAVRTPSRSRPQPGDLPTIRYDGQNHTLH
ncbi:MAG: hypothetical protein MJD61_16250 [Proteobacteria bacterium]|nr:hypothetical protein [Pseudomonadota bacterium]